MKITCVLWTPIVAGLVLFVALPTGRAVVAQSRGPVQPIVLIVSPSFGVRNISLALARRAFRGDVTELSGKRLVPFNYGTANPVRLAFDELALGLAPAQIGAYWIDRRIRGQGMAPRTVPSPLIMKAVVAKLSGSIGYVTADQLDPSVAALTVDGKSHERPDYPLQPR